MAPVLENTPGGLSRTAVAITGIGLPTGLGNDRETTWRALCQGESALRWLDRPDLPARDTDTPWAGGPSLAASDARTSGAEPLLALIDHALDEALRDAGWPPVGRTNALVDPDRLGVVIGWSKGGFHLLSRWADSLSSANACAGMPESPWWLSWPSGGSVHAGARLGARGPRLAPVAACATGVVGMLRGAELIQRGVCDAVCVGAADAGLEPLILASFRQMKVLAKPRPNGEPPSTWVRPWDAERSGFLVGEGGAICLLEKAENALNRGIRPYAYLLGGALGGDAHHITALDPNPSRLAGVIQNALNDAGIRADDLDYVNVHGTATPGNDPLECRALRLALGSDNAERIACSANKGQLGHLLGAAGAVETALTCLALRDGIIPPTVNLDHPDPACDLDGTPHIRRHRVLRYALKLSLGFGGHLAAIVLQRGPRTTP